MDGKTGKPVVSAEDRVGHCALECYADVHWLELVKNRMAETGESQGAAEYAVALTPEGKKTWEAARNSSLKRG